MQVTTLARPSKDGVAGHRDPLDLYDIYSYHIAVATRLGALTKRLRRERGLSQRALGARAGITNPYITQLETGQRGNPTVLVAVRLADALGVPVMKLVECIIKDEAQAAVLERRTKR